MLSVAVLLGLVLTAEPVKAEVPLGQPIEIKVTLKNDGKEAFNGPVLVLDKRSVTLAIGEGSKQFVYQRKLDKPPETKGLPAGESWSATISYTAVRAGEVPIEASYAEKASSATKVSVKPAADGASELGALLVTTKGELRLRFFPEVAPNHVAHFAERVRTGFYDATPFHRVIQKFMAQGGDPEGTGRGGPGYTIPAEFTNDSKYSHTFGRLSTARTPDPDSGGSQFFLCFDEATFLDGQYTVFGEVIDGQPVVRKIEAIGVPPRTEGRPKEIVKIKSASLIPLKGGS